MPPSPFFAAPAAGGMWSTPSGCCNRAAVPLPSASPNANRSDGSSPVVRGSQACSAWGARMGGHWGRALTSADDGLGITPILPEVYGTHGARFGVGYEEGHVALFAVLGNTQS